MTEKVYKARSSKIVLNLFWMSVGALFVGWLASAFIATIFAYALGVLIFVISILFAIKDISFAIKISNNHLLVEKRGQIKQDFDLQTYGFEAKTKTTRGVTGDTEYILIVVHPNGNKETIDCDLIGGKKFYELLEDLKLYGDNADINDLKTTKK